MEADNKLYFYPLWLRIWHGINALGIILLIITGISMQSGINSKFINFHIAVSVHNICGVIVTINYVFYFFTNMFTKNSKFYIVEPEGFLKRPIKQAIYYAWGMFHGMKPPYPLSEKRKFNPLQKYFYILVMYLAVPCVIISGIGLLFPEIIIENIYKFSGIYVTAVFHAAMGFFISMFLIIHLYVSTIGKSPLENFKGIITGWHSLNH